MQTQNTAGALNLHYGTLPVCVCASVPDSSGYLPFPSESLLTHNCSWTLEAHLLLPEAPTTASQMIQWVCGRIRRKWAAYPVCKQVRRPTEGVRLYAHLYLVCAALWVSGLGVSLGIQCTV